MCVHTHYIMKNILVSMKFSWILKTIDAKIQNECETMHRMSQVLLLDNRCPDGIQQAGYLLGISLKEKKGNEAGLGRSYPEMKALQTLGQSHQELCNSMACQRCPAGPQNSCIFIFLADAGCLGRGFIGKSGSKKLREMKRQMKNILVPGAI